MQLLWTYICISVLCQVAVVAPRAARVKGKNSGPAVPCDDACEGISCPKLKVCKVSGSPNFPHFAKCMVFEKLDSFMDIYANPCSIGEPAVAFTGKRKGATTQCTENKDCGYHGDNLECVEVGGASFGVCCQRDSDCNEGGGDGGDDGDGDDDDDHHSHHKHHHNHKHKHHHHHPHHHGQAHSHHGHDLIRSTLETLIKSINVKK